MTKLDIARRTGGKGIYLSLISFFRNLFITTCTNPLPLFFAFFSHPLCQLCYSILDTVVDDILDLQLVLVVGVVLCKVPELLERNMVMTVCTQKTQNVNLCQM